MAKDRKSFNVQMQPHYELLLRPQSVIQSLLNQSFSTQWPSFALKATGSLNIEHWIEHWYEHCTFNIEHWMNIEHLTFNIEHWYEHWMNIEHLTLIIEHFLNIAATICYLLPLVSATFSSSRSSTLWQQQRRAAFQIVLIPSGKKGPRVVNCTEKCDW